MFECLKDINTWLLYTTLHSDKFCAYLVFTPMLVSNCRDNPKRVEKYLSHLRDVDWSKTNPAWQNQVVASNGKLLSRSGSRKFLTEFMLEKMNLADKLQAA